MQDSLRCVNARLWSARFLSFITVMFFKLLKNLKGHLRLRGILLGAIAPPSHPLVTVPALKCNCGKSDDSLIQQVAIDKIKLTSTYSPGSTARYYSNPPFEQLVTPRGAQLTAARNELAPEAGTSFWGEDRGGICSPLIFKNFCRIWDKSFFNTVL